MSLLNFGFTSAEHVLGDESSTMTSLADTAERQETVTEEESEDKELSTSKVKRRQLCQKRNDAFAELDS